MSDFTPSVGLHLNLADAEYHGSKDWLSASGIKKLIPPSTPAHFRLWADGPEQEPKAHFDLGKVVHRLVLGRGAEFEVVQKVTRDKQRVNADDLITKSAQEHAAEIRAAGKVPMIHGALAEAQEMAAAVLADDVAAKLFSAGHAEASAYWLDPATEVRCRARFDWLPEKVEGRRLVVPDLKTAANASPKEFAKAAGNYSYHLQDAHYSDAIEALGIEQDPLFLFVVVEKRTNLVNILPFSKGDRSLAHAVCDRARRIYKQCVETGDWYGYRRPTEIGPEMRLPPYITYDQEEFVA